MAQLGWTVQSAFYCRNSHATRENSPTLCREAAQSNQVLSWRAGFMCHTGKLERSEKTCVSEGESPSSLEVRLPEFGTKVTNGKV